MRAIVTGANGHLGAALCNVLAVSNYEVKALIRNPQQERLKHINYHSFEIVDYDLMDEHRLTQLFKGADYIFHAAAPTQLWSKNTEDITRPIYEGTLNVIRAAARAQVPKIIYTSTGATVGFSRGEKEALDEENYNLKTRHPQFKAKLKAELDGSRLAAKLGIRFIRICPPNIIGPGFATCSPSTKPYVRLYKAQLPAIPNVSYYTNDVRDLAQAHLLLAQNDPHYDRYIIAAHYATPELLLDLAQDLLKDFRRPKIISSGILCCAWLGDMLAYYLSFKKRNRELTFDLLKECSGCEQKLSTKRFREEFASWHPRSLKTTLSDMFMWIKEHCV